MLRNLASSLFLTERDSDFYEGLTGPDGRKINAPGVSGRVITTLEKAKEVRSLVEKCITLARQSLPHEDAAKEFATSARRNTEEWRSWRKSDRWQKWARAMAPAVAARRRALKMLGDKEAVSILFADVAPRFVDRPGGYTRIVRLAKPRLGDAGTRAILEFVGTRDRQHVRSVQPAFTSDAEKKADESA